MTRAIHWLGGAVLLVIVAGPSYQWISWNRDAKRFPEPGHLVNAAGIRFQLHCTGAGSPTVLLESGLGDTLEEWRRVQSEVAVFTRVCSYDRAGYGNSDPGPFPRTSDRIAHELHALLECAGERPPYILVGHSAGGYHVRVFHGRFADEVSAMVLVDATQEDQYRLLPPAWNAMGAAMVERYQRQARWAPVEVDFGLKRLMLWSQGTPPPYLLLQTKYFQARASEIATIQRSAEQARAAGTLGDKPLVVLTGARSSPGDGLSPRDAEACHRIWVEDLQPRLAALSTNATRIVLPDSGHDIPADRPDAITSAIRHVIQASK